MADSTVSHAATSTQTTVATIKKKIPFDATNGALTKLAIGKKMRAVNSRVPPNTGAHTKDDTNNTASMYNVCHLLLHNYCSSILKYSFLCVEKQHCITNVL